jgi:hypothetical protein
MGRVWVLDLDASGTGAEMRPLDSVLQEPERQPDLALVRPKPQPRPEEAPQPPAPRRFKVVDVMSGLVRAEHASARATVDLLEDARSIGDVRIYVWETERDRWRLLTLAEQRTLWRLRGNRGSRDPD